MADVVNEDRQQALSALGGFAQEAPYLNAGGAAADLGPSEYGGGFMQAAAAAAAAGAGAGDTQQRGDDADAAAAGAHDGEAPAAGAGEDAAAAAAAAAAGPSSSRQGSEQLPYAAVREAAAVNAAADGAADEAMRAVTAAQATIQALLHPAPMMMHDDGSGHGHHGRGHGGRSRRGGRAAAAIQFDAYGMPIYGAAPGGRQNKGLRHFSMKVCEKVESKGVTTYNDVADELVAELQGGGVDADGQYYDEKNIRRRVYDAINVLMALDIISKEKKNIHWHGFPTTRSAAQQVAKLQAEQLGVMGEVGRKAQYLADLVEQQKALRHLLGRNGARPAGEARGTALSLPFILVQSKPDATVEVQISPDMRDVQFNFLKYPFEIHDDALVLRKMLEHENLEKLAAVAHGTMGAMGFPHHAGLSGADTLSYHQPQAGPSPLGLMAALQQQARAAAAAAAQDGEQQHGEQGEGQQQQQQGDEDEEQTQDQDFDQEDDEDEPMDADEGGDDGDDGDDEPVSHTPLPDAAASGPVAAAPAAAAAAAASGGGGDEDMAEE